MWAVIVPGRPSLKRLRKASGETVHGSRKSGWQCPSTTARPARSTARAVTQSGRAVAVGGGQSEPASRLSLAVELDQHRRLGSDDPGVVARLEDDRLRRDQLEAAA